MRATSDNLLASQTHYSSSEEGDPHIIPAAHQRNGNHWVITAFIVAGVAGVGWIGGKMWGRKASGAPSTNLVDIVQKAETVTFECGEANMQIENEKPGTSGKYMARDWDIHCKKSEKHKLWVMSPDCRVYRSYSWNRDSRTMDQLLVDGMVECGDSCHVFDVDGEHCETKLSHSAPNKNNYCYGYLKGSNWCYLTSDGKSAWVKDGDGGYSCSSYDGYSSYDYCENIKEGREIIHHSTSHNTQAR